MKIAVLMCTYNGEKYLREQINSILNQNGDFQIALIIRDDGSNDRTLEILQEYKKNSKVKIEYGKNKGPALGFMELLYKNRGYDFYAFSDQDDVWKPNKLLKGISKLSSQKGPALYFANATLVDSELHSLNLNVYKKKPILDFRSLSCNGGILGCTLILNNALAKRIQHSNLPSKIVMHDFYVSELCKLINGSIIYDPESVMFYRQHGNNVVGVSYGFINKIISRIKDIYEKPDVGIDSQAGDLLVNYKQYFSIDKIRWLRKIQNYKANFYTRFSLAFNPGLKFVNRNQELKIRMSILMGNR
ncbi:glycosyltransferase [Limosilactobacillus pontis]|uniref:glycosyltransferase n=1 Tax=Limosilactobacillus pontis TaxID=35787 RepID=UPI002F265F4D